MNFKELVKKSQSLEATYKVTPDIYYSFQRISNDYNPLHTDVSFAQKKGFSDRVMYGNILNAFVSHFVGMVIPSREVMIQTQDIQYRKPVYMGNEILLKAVPEDISEAVEIVNFKLKFYRLAENILELVATGHVQIGMLHNK